MPRIVKTADVRRDEILTAAYKLFVRHGYEATTVNALIDELGLSKGAFYHHFASKDEVLQALARRMAEEMYKKALPLVERRDLSPLDKLNLMFGTGAQYKKAQLPMVRAMAEIYLRDENLRLRNRMMAEAIAVVGPLFARILDEGKQDSSFSIDDPVETARLMIHLGTYLHDTYAEAARRAATDLPGAVAQLRRRVDAYARALERILGIGAYTLDIVDDETIALFLAPEKS
jgi:AcrR family transcriptional regulator